jgi:hypothetical protein
MNKYLKIVQNVIECVLCNSSRCHYLEPLKNEVIAKMAYLVEFWLILASELVECAPQGIFVIECVLCNSSRCHYLEPLKNEVIAKMAYLVEFWLILASELVKCAPQGIFVVWI